MEPRCVVRAKRSGFVGNSVVVETFVNPPNRVSVALPEEGPKEDFAAQQPLGGMQERWEDVRLEKFRR
jgi:hypothetical protein